MRVLISGSQGYLGTVTAQVITAAGHEVTGLDTGLFAGCVMGAGPIDPPTLATDLRDVTAADLTGFDAVIHLAALPGSAWDPTNREVVRHVNHLAAVRLALAAKDAGVGRYLFASTCAVYGERREEPVTESAPLRPLTALAESKLRVEEEVSELADSDFVPVFLRLASTFGFSPRFRSDRLLNLMVGDAVFSGEVAAPLGENTRRPMVHVRDAADAFLRCLTARTEVVDCAAFNVGSESNTVTGTEIARAVVAEVPGATLGGTRVGVPVPGPGRVDFGAIRRDLGFEARWGIADGVAELHRAYVGSGVGADDFFSRYCRRRRLRAMRESGELDDDVRRQGVLA
ncbi:MAG: NAD-dependent epimerase/dehydratase family protein [Dietzia sp.]